MQLFKLAPLCSLSLAISVLTGCAAVVKTPYHAPRLSTPEQFQFSQTAKGQPVDQYADRWWTLFQDAQLNQLIDQVLAKNTDLAVAGIAIKQAYLNTGLAADQQGLRASSSISAGHKVDIHSGNDSSQGLSINAGVSYEVDLFGKLARQTEAKKWEALATEQDLQATAQTLIGTTAKLYWQLAYYNESLNTAQKSLATSEQLYNLVKTQYSAGAVSGLDLTEAEQSVQSQKASLSQAEQNLVETRTAIAVLLHIPVQQLQLTEPKQLPAIRLPEIAAGLPASILSRRPDLRASELRLRESLATKDATTASYYPSISLTSALGASSTSLTQLIKNPALTLGASFSLPFLQYNDMKKNIAISQLDYEKAILQYRQSLYQALADVENALSNRIELNKQVEAQQRNVDLAEKVERLTAVRYQNGAVALKTLLDQQQTTRTARLSLVDIEQNQYNAYVTLMQALGGSPVKTAP